MRSTLDSNEKKSVYLVLKLMEKKCMFAWILSHKYTFSSTQVSTNIRYITTLRIVITEFSTLYIII
jgi:hypothetical protein